MQVSNSGQMAAIRHAAFLCMIVMCGFTGPAIANGGGSGGGGGWGGGGWGGSGCPTGYANCDHYSKSCSTSIKNDVNNCGKCGNKCPSYTCATPTCTWGVCGSSCTPGFKDCDSKPQNGCETNVDNDAMNCGGCGTKCPAYPFSTTTCSNGKCNPVCNSGMKNCNGNWMDGCETDTGKDTNNCGGCGIKCPMYPHSTTSCSNGKCTPVCLPGWKNCNGDWKDGCETDTGMDSNNCGGCGAKCPTYPFSTTTCSNGKCNPVCNSGMKNCNGNWMDGCETDTGKDMNNCGGCGIKCPVYPHSTTTCSNGKCTPVCNAGWKNCNGDWKDGCETDTGMDSNNCGGCGAKCPTYPFSTTTCSNGKCNPVCNSGMKNCNGNLIDGCETDTGKDANNCGACGIKCPVYPHSTTSCSNGKCTPVCNAGWKNCNGDWKDGCETDTGTDSNNCGACGIKCPIYPHSTTSCSNGKCTPVCLPGWKNCNGDWKDGCETDTGMDSNNCGGCGAKCPTYPYSTNTCSNGKCNPVCNSGMKNCNGNLMDGCETDTGKDMNNCGGCGIKCPVYPHSTTSCSNGKCTPVCLPGWKNCNGDWKDGCETNVGMDSNNCGGCGAKCPIYPYSTTTCSNSKCNPVCNSGWKNCNGDWKDGCETDTGKDSNNCGVCGAKCPVYPHSTTSCSNGKCNPVCQPGWKNCNGDWKDGCEKDVNTDVNNCGACGKACPCADVNALPTCSNGSCGVQCKSGFKYDTYLRKCVKA